MLYFLGPWNFIFVVSYVLDREFEMICFPRVVLWHRVGSLRVVNELPSHIGELSLLPCSEFQPQWPFCCSSEMPCCSDFRTFPQPESSNPLSLQGWFLPFSASISWQLSWPPNLQYCFPIQWILNSFLFLNFFIPWITVWNDLIYFLLTYCLFC
jgi:hypothetical protein